MKTELVFKKVKNFNKKNLQDINKLLLGWSGMGYQISPSYLDKFIKNSHFLVALDGESLIGMVTVVPIYKVSGVKGSIEHLFIDEKYRGKGIGKDLMSFAIDLAKKLKIETLFLTCEPNREVANKLYQKLGFKVKDTNFYYLDLK